ncbi:hypothetical protein [Phocaeicola sp.]
MILPSQSESQILAELDQDYTWIASRVKKEARKNMAKIQKTGLVKRDYQYEYRITSPNNNKWFLLISIDVLRKQKVYFSCNCSAESAHGNLDYYMLRGRTFGGKYFVRVTSHTISRIKERFPLLGHLDGNQICTKIFLNGEEGSGMKLTDHRFIEFINKAKDFDDVCILLTTSLGIFFSYHTPGNNSVLKTYITPEMVGDEREEEICRYCMAGYAVLNRKKYSEEDIEKSMKVLENYRIKYGVTPIGYSFPE